MNTMEKAKSILSAALFIPIEKISDDGAVSSLKELNSLSFEMIIVEIEKHLGHEVDPMKLLELRSVKDLAALLEG